jgi:putative CocE/NonD family hydrolase
VTGSPVPGGDLSVAAPELSEILARNELLSAPLFAVPEVVCETVQVVMRDGVRLATDVYRPPVSTAPAVVLRTPYGRDADGIVPTLLSLARRGYVVASQDCRGTGSSEPNHWDYYVREPEDGIDFIDWVARQPWFDGFIGAFGASYVGQTQWQMAMHPAMSAIVPEVSGLGVALNTAHLHMFVNAYARTVGRGDEKTNAPLRRIEAMFEEETMAGGFYDEPLVPELPASVLEAVPGVRGASPSQARKLLWEHYCALSSAERAELIKAVMGTQSVSIVEVEQMTRFFGPEISHDRHTLPHPDPAQLSRLLQAPALMVTGWYDWGLNDALASWELLVRAAEEPMRSRCRLLISPSAHNMTGYHEGMGDHPELLHAYREPGATHLELLLRWYDAVRNDTTGSWPRVIYYLMGAGRWQTAEAWPPPDVAEAQLYLGPDGALTPDPPTERVEPDGYVYDPDDPTPTVGGSIVSYVYPPGSVDVSQVQQRPDVLTYTTPVLSRDVDVVGPLTFVLYASSSATDTDFAVRLSDVFPDGRAIQLQNGVLRARYRDLPGDPVLLEPGEVYRLEVDMWATANRFAAGHRIRIDISSADFPRLDRNANLGGAPGTPISAEQRVHRGPEHPSHLVLPIVGPPLSFT